MPNLTRGSPSKRVWYHVKFHLECAMLKTTSGSADHKVTLPENIHGVFARKITVQGSDGYNNWIIPKVWVEGFLT